MVDAPSREVLLSFNGHVIGPKGADMCLMFHLGAINCEPSDKYFSSREQFPDAKEFS